MGSQGQLLTVVVVGHPGLGLTSVSSQLDNLQPVSRMMVVAVGGNLRRSLSQQPQPQPLSQGSPIRSSSSSSSLVSLSLSHLSHPRASLLMALARYR